MGPGAVDGHGWLVVSVQWGATSPLPIRVWFRPTSSDGGLGMVDGISFAWVLVATVGIALKNDMC